MPTQKVQGNYTFEKRESSLLAENVIASVGSDVGLLRGVEKPNLRENLLHDIPTLLQISSEVILGRRLYLRTYHPTCNNWQ